MSCPRAGTDLLIGYLLAVDNKHFRDFCNSTAGRGEMETGKVPTRKDTHQAPGELGPYQDVHLCDLFCPSQQPCEIGIITPALRGPAEKLM